MRLAATAVVGLTIGFALELSDSFSTTFSGAPRSKSFDISASPGSRTLEMQVASLQPEFTFASGIEDAERPPQFADFSSGFSFSQRLFSDGRARSFDERWSTTGSTDDPERRLSFDEYWSATGLPNDMGLRLSFEEHWSATSLPNDLKTAATEKPVNRALSRPDVVARALARPAIAKSAPTLASVTSSTPNDDPQRLTGTAEAGTGSNSSPDADDHTAIYDIVAHTVYLPDGRRLEAHSGFGRLLDDPRYVNVRDWGPTPPNVYDLALREEPFHGVHAIRLTPLDSGKMFGRDGILAHSYMLGSNGQSNGCVSFDDYDAFLNAYLNGEINRLVVVEHLATTPTSKSALRWLPESIRAMFVRS